MSRLTCRIADLGEIVDHAVNLERHRRSCLRCQAEAARTHKLHRALRGMRGELETAPTELVGEVAARLDSREALAAPSQLAAIRHTAAALGAVAAAAVGAAALAVWRRSQAVA